MKYTYTLCVLLMFFSVTLHAQLVPQKQTGEIRGKVFDSKTKKPLGFVSIVLLNERNILKAQVISDEEGNYILKSLDPGEYTLKLTFIGYVNATVTEVEVMPDTITFQNVRMEQGGAIICGSCCLVRRTVVNTDVKKDILSYQKLRKEYAIECDQDFSCVLPHKSRQIENKLKESAVKLFNEVAAFPNPAIDHINIESMYDGNKLIKIYSLTGALYYSGTIVHHLHLDVTSFPKGFYIATIIDKDNDEKNYIKFIVGE